MGNEITAEIQVVLHFPEGMSPEIAIPLAFYYWYLIQLGISYRLERARIIEEFYAEQSRNCEIASIGLEH